MDCESMLNGVSVTDDRWQAVESAFNDLTDTDAPIGGCDECMFQPGSERLMLTGNLNPLECSSNFSLVSRLIASVTPVEEVGIRAGVLLRHYMDLRGLMKAAASDIQHNEILTVSERMVLRTVKDVSTNFLRECLNRQTRIASFAELHQYLKVSLASEQTEVTRLLMMDVQNHVIADELQGVGKLNQTKLFPKEVVARAVAHNAAAIIIVHSHPSGDPEPTRADIKLTKRLAFVLEELGITLYDHVVVGRRVVVSLRRLGVLDEEG